ncbi:hypothetical protein U6A24_07620 [Aquimarina gracilis]|uniref:Uncharacterized protein n=1 Tax=Aquimarina gracilis TaxID=874422 RepID=A0ABU5ZTA5_9FLAO|nr:hypothetical protein [Aquimarina gracilis]MEB3345320.1 hypothetical protein [Aquimarina gracilis]
MEKVKVDFRYLTPELVSKIVAAYPNGFANSDVMTFACAANEDIEMIKLEIDDTLYLIKKSAIDDAAELFDDNYFSSLQRKDEACDAEFCE